MQARGPGQGRPVPNRDRLRPRLPRRWLPRPSQDRRQALWNTRGYLPGCSGNGAEVTVTTATTVPAIVNAVGFASKFVVATSTSLVMYNGTDVGTAVSLLMILILLCYCYCLLPLLTLILLLLLLLLLLFVIATDMSTAAATTTTTTRYYLISVL